MYLCLDSGSKPGVRCPAAALLRFRGQGKVLICIKLEDDADGKLIYEGEAFHYNWYRRGV